MDKNDVTLILTEVLGAAERYQETTTAGNLLAAAKGVTASQMVDDKNPALRERLIEIAGIIVGGVNELDQRLAAEGVGG